MFARSYSQLVSLGALAWLASPSIFSVRLQAQIAAAVDAEGRTVYVNASPLTVSRTAASKSAKYSRLLPASNRPSAAKLASVGTAAVGRTQQAQRAADSDTASSLRPRSTALADRPAVPNPVIEPLPFDRLVENTATESQVDPRLVHAIIQVESEYNPRALSPKGAMGLMQLIPSTARRFGVADPFDPAENVRGGVSYLRHLLDMFGGDVPLSVAAYNAGENAVLRAEGIPRIQETQAYVRRVTERYASGDAAAPPELWAGRRYPSAQGSLGAGEWIAPAAAIYRYVDGSGVVHYSQ